MLLLLLLLLLLTLLVPPTPPSAPFASALLHLSHPTMQPACGCHLGAAVSARPSFLPLIILTYCSGIDIRGSGS